jgi:hypothetical protein
MNGHLHLQSVLASYFHKTEGIVNRRKVTFIQSKSHDTTVSQPTKHTNDVSQETVSTILLPPIKITATQTLDET